MEEIKLLIRLIESKISSDWNVNYGGCGVFALLLHQELKKVGINSRIALFSVDMNRSYFFELNKIYNQKQSCSHIMLRIQNEKEVIYIDSEGTYTLKQAKKFKGYSLNCVGFYSENSLKESLSVRNQWSYVYNWSNNKVMGKIICESVSTIFGQTTKNAA